MSVSPISLLTSTTVSSASAAPRPAATSSSKAADLSAQLRSGNVIRSPLDDAIAFFRDAASSPPVKIAPDLSDLQPVWFDSSNASKTETQIADYVTQVHAANSRPDSDLATLTGNSEGLQTRATSGQGSGETAAPPTPPNTIATLQPARFGQLLAALYGAN